MISVWFFETAHVYKITEFGITRYPYRVLALRGAIRAEGEEADSGWWVYLSVHVKYPATPHPPPEISGVYIDISAKRADV